MNLRPNMTAQTSTFDAGALLQLLESQRASGTVRCGELSLRLRDGLIVKACGDLLDQADAAQLTVELLLETSGVLTFRRAKHAPAGDLQLSPTALLLEAARCSDEARRAA